MIGSIGVMAGYREPTDDGSIVLVSKNAQNKNCSLNGDCKQKIQARIDDVETIFYERVIRNTGLSKAEIASHFSYGDVISATEAQEVGFLEEVTTFDILLKSLKTNSTVAVPTVSDDKPVILNQGADMKFDRENLDETEKTFNALLANRDTMTSRSDKLEMQVQTATAALEAKEDEINSLNATHATQLSEAESKFKAEAGTRVQEAISCGASAEVAVAMINADSAEDASKLVLSAKESDGATQQADADVEKTKEKASVDYATNIAKNYSI